MIRKISKYIENHQLLQLNDKIIVGLSGGADSVALLHTLRCLDYSCIAAHCNFHLRGKESDRDETFAREEARKLNIPFYKKDFDTTAYAEQNRISIEMAARELRYQWFEKLRKELYAQVIAVGHHQDDSIETFLLNLIRGTGIRGLSGIHPKNGSIIRPLLAVNRYEIVQWLAKQKIEYQTDSTNLSDEYTRNFIRLRVLPLLKELNPAINEAILRTSGHLSDLEKLYLTWVENERKQLIDKQKRISIPQLLKSAAPQSLLYELIKPYGFTSPLSDSIFESLQKQSGKVFDAPDSDYRIVKDRNFLLLTTQKQKDNVCYTVNANDTLSHPIHLKTHTEEVNQSSGILKKKTIAFLDYDQLAFPLTLRTWNEGDWFIPFGMKGHKKLSDYFSDRKFSRIQKDQTWLLCSGSDIVWIVGERIDERYRIKNTTKMSLIVEYFM
jgi:tRNA(Ile)-lysidine synthase